jgi:dihydrofolate synthase/folylpolyglutamate synthase
VITAAALLGFRGRRVDAAVLEVGLGGRLDATNATEPVASAIVSIDLDHVAMLGTTLARSRRRRSRSRAPDARWSPRDAGGSSLRSSARVAGRSARSSFPRPSFGRG